MMFTHLVEHWGRQRVDYLADLRGDQKAGWFPKSEQMMVHLMAPTRAATKVEQIHLVLRMAESLAL